MTPSFAYDGMVRSARGEKVSSCEKKGWTPHPFPYCDADSIRYARIAVDYLGFDDDIDLSEPQW